MLKYVKKMLELYDQVLTPQNMAEMLESANKKNKEVIKFQNKMRTIQQRIEQMR
jgi:oligoendopeptidase F